jgi:prepilin peptidase CpaA
MSLLLLTEAAVLCDLSSGRIPNGLILAGLGLGVIYQYFSAGLMGLLLCLGGILLPLILMGPLYYFRMIGAGDIKLFCALGGFLGPGMCFRCIVWAVLAGGVMALALLCYHRNLTERIFYLIDYVTEYVQTGVWKPYLPGVGRQARFCFSIPVLFSILCYIGGIM